MSPETSQPEASPNGRGEWDSLNEMYKNCGAYTIIPALLGPFIQNKELVQLIPDPAALAESMSVLAKDVKTYADGLNAIRNQHANKSGSSADPDDLMHCIRIHENYIKWATSYESVVVPQIVAVLEQFESVGADTSSIRDAVSKSVQEQG
jgi:hypothetical protein